MKIGVWGLAIAVWMNLGFEAIAEPPVEVSEAQIPHARLDDLNFFAREWNCVVSHPGSDAVNQAFVWKVSRELNNFWFLGRGETPEGIHFQQDTFGYNTLMQKFGRTILGHDGKFANFLSDGWNKNEMVWVGSVVDMTQGTTDKHKIIVQRIADHEFSATEFKSGHTPESWEAIATKTCTCRDLEKAE